MRVKLRIRKEESEMKNAPFFHSRTGMSLIVVLLFMLVATIAATATYKWITSEGKSSSSRMLQREAYQSSVAGIENARAWMTFHANETGALIRQYLYNADGTLKANKTPINIDQQVRSFANGANQDHHVWLMGVNTENSTYKVKIMSEGISRNGQARHTEVAILNVAGLYQVETPVQQVQNIVPLAFDFNYFGGSTRSEGHIGAKSMLINGNLNGSNPVYAQTDLIVTGNVNISGNSVGADGNICVGGNFDANNGVFGGNVYVGGDAEHFTWPAASEAKNTFTGVTVNSYDLAGNVYIEGNLAAPTPGDQIFPQNLTLNGVWTTNLEAHESSVTGNLCLGDKGFVYLPKLSRTFSVGGNVWMPGNVDLPGNISFWKGDMSGESCVCNKYELVQKWEGMHLKWEWEFKESVSCERSRSYSTGYGYGAKSYKEVVQICNGDVEFSVENDNEADYDKIILGASTNSKVYIKNANTLTGYDSLRASKLVTTTDKQVQYCGGGTCEGTDEKKWKNEPLYAYKEMKKKQPKAGQTAADVPNPNYVYYLPSNTHDVGWGQYYDEFWDKNIDGFFVNFTGDTKDTTTRYTDSYHSYGSCSGHQYQPIHKEGGCFRMLNHDGDKIKGSPYCRKRAGKNFVPECGVAPWFGSFGTVTGVIPSLKSFECSESVKTYCLAKLGTENDNGCDGASYKVDDLLTTAYTSFVEYANLGCASVTTWNGTLSTDLNTCYSNNSADHPENLYHGYQVVKVNAGGNKADPKTPLEGKFIIIVDDSIAQQSLPPTTANSYVFLYLSKGSKANATLQPADDNNGKTYNYFIYTTGDISGFLFNNDVLSGSIYAEAENCAKVGDFKARKMEYNEALLNDLQNSYILCDASVEQCGTVTAGGGGGGAGAGAAGQVVNANLRDPYFVSNAPQLGVVIESQYKAVSEPVPTLNEATVLSPSFIVLPRIIYLNRDPYGTLNDYFNVIPLNGASVSKANANVVCNPGLNVNTNLVSGAQLLEEGLYECSANPDGYTAVPFYVWVQGRQRGIPEVSFVDEYIPVEPGENQYDVKLHVPGHANNLIVSVSCPPAPAGWTWEFDNSDPSVTHAQNGNTCTFTFGGPLNEESTPTLFKVTSPEEAGVGSLVFMLQPGEGYQLAVPWSSTLMMSAVATLNRENVTSTEINEFCASNADVCPPTKYRLSWPDCPAGHEWVIPNWGSNYTVEVQNNTWNIISSPAGTLTLKEQPGSGCVVIIPSSNNSQAAPIEGGQTYVLRASGKATWHKVTLEFKGDVNGKMPFVSTQSGNRVPMICSYDESSTHTCEVPVFGGEYFHLSINKDDVQNSGFSYWKCSGPSCPTTDAVGSTDFSQATGFAVNDDNTVIGIHFGEKDQHCFFDEFRRYTLQCRTTTDPLDSIYCVEDCLSESDNEICTGVTDASASYENAKWHLLTGSLSDINRNASPSYIYATVSSGIKVISTVKAGVHGTLRALLQVPHVKTNEGKNSARIKNSGFILRSNSAGTDYQMLNLYENMSGNLEAQLCAGSSCQSREFKRDEYIPLSLSGSSIVMLSAKMDEENLLTLEAFAGSYFYNNGYSPTRYTAQFNLAQSTAPAASYEYVGFSLADKEFKLYGIGWQSDDYNSECFDGPPTVKCSYAAVAVDGIIEVEKYTKPWVGHSGWFDSKDCSVNYWYFNGEDVQNACNTDNENGADCGTDGYSFKTAGKGQHGYVDDESHNDVKTAKASMTCSAGDNETRAWNESVELAHCGPFWTGAFSECKADILNMLGTPYEVSGSSSESKFWTASKDAKNLRGDTLVIELSNTSEADVNLEVALISKNPDDRGWGTLDIVSKSVTITGSAAVIKQSFVVANDFANNTTTGFDPENVIGVLFTNHSTSAVEVSDLSVKCKNAIRFTGCSLEQNGESSWKVTMNVADENKTKVTSVNVTATVDGASEENLSVTATCPGCMEVIVPDNDIYKNKGKKYIFSAKVNATGYESILTETKTCSPPITPSGITCTVNDISDIAGGAAWPQFSADLNNCPAAGCKYTVTFSADANAFITDGSTSSQVRHTRSGTAPVCNTEGGCTYTYTLNSKEDSKPFSCSASFRVLQAGTEPISCSIPNTTVNASGSDLGATLAIAHNDVSVSGCSAGNCTYTIKEGTASVTTATTWSADYDLSLPVVSEVGSHSYTVAIQRGEENPVACSGTYVVNYPLNLACPTFTDPGADSPVAAGSTINPEHPTTITGTTSGCNSNCSYAVTGGNNVSGGSGTGYSGTGTIASFTDADASGEQSYTLTVSHGTGSSATSISCPFTVTYESAADECHCTCGDCTNVRSTTYSDNHNGPGMFCFFIDNENVKLRMDTYTKEDDSPNTKPHCSVVINGVSLKKFSGTELKNLVTSKVDGGYYIYVGNDASAVTNTDFCSFQFETSHTSTTNPCGSGSGGGGSGGGSGTDVELSSQGMDSYTKGTYTLKTGSGLGSGSVPKTFKCRTENIRPSTIRVVGTIYLGNEKKYDISISAYNDYSQGYDLNSETTYTFNVDNSIDNLECGLWF